MNVMVVDDSKTNAYVVARMLIEADYNVVTAGDAEEALALLQDHPEIQVLIVDWVLPRMDGPELTQIIRREYNDPYRYIIMLTAKSGQDARVEGLESGVDDYMEKPVNVPELTARLHIAERILKLETDLRGKIDQVERVRREWEATTDAVAQLICLVDRDGTVMHVNRTVEAWGLGFQADCIGLRLDALLARGFPQVAGKFRDHWPVMRARLLEGCTYEDEYADRTTGHYLHVQLQPVERSGSRNGTVNSFAAVSIQDITERKRLEIQLQDANDRSERLLNNILPEPIARRLREGEVTIAESYENVTVLFADLVGFTRLTSALPPTELMELLNGVFSAFDYLSERHGLEKIKTIGDAYMAVGGLPKPTADHAMRVANMALDMQETIQRLSEASGQPLVLRIGIDSGPVVAGVIGRSKFIYDLWGDTVNTASRMESTGVSGGIQVTRTTYDLLRESFHLQARGVVDVQGKGQVEAYLLQGARHVSDAG